MDKFKDMKVALVSLGCDKNTVDSEIMLGILAQQGFVLTADTAQAEIIIINTCGFLQDAVDESYMEIQAAIAQKQAGVCRAIIVTGCAAARYKEEILGLDGVDGVMGVDEYANLIPVVQRALGQSATVKPLTADLAMLRIPSTPKHYAYLRIAEGCDKNCTYCTIPAIRGAYTSHPMENILEEAARLAGLGVKELILVAQDTTLYGTDIYEEQKLHVLLNKLSKIDGIHWLRLLYCYPEHIYDDLLEEMAKNPKILPYIDLPIQHCSDKILKLMNRKSTEEKLRNTIAHIRKAVPGVTLRTTLITGFPGETKEDFQNLCNFIEDMKFDRLGVFPYSREEGTPADNLPNHLEEKTKIARHDRLMKIQQRISAENLALRKGDVYEIVVEGMEENGIYLGRSYAEAPDIDGIIFISSEKELEMGGLVQVKITETWEYDMMGEVFD
ncbi:MAG: 30S ribosomal protein S12 methylthiotransferase RimO [Defluviitaleaceae bacterium]|nr:30S ribosomal protein S12 methylthiotransferase RimO [Defluviitaleaceae bacterium]